MILQKKRGRCKKISMAIKGFPMHPKIALRERLELLQVLAKFDILNKIMINQQVNLSFSLLLKFDGQVWHGHLKFILFGLKMF